MEPVGEALTALLHAARVDLKDESSSMSVLSFDCFSSKTMGRTSALRPEVEMRRSGMMGCSGPCGLRWKPNLSSSLRQDETGGDMKLQRLRAFNETGLRMLRGRAPTFRWRWRVSPRLTLPQNCRWSGDPS